MSKDRQTFVRLSIAMILAVVALGLFLLNRPRMSDSVPISQRDLSSTIEDIDKGVDSVLAQFHIERSWTRKRKIPIRNDTEFRIERRIAIPRDVLPLSMNVALNAMARRYHGRAIASENLKENTVTIHIELLGNIIQTIILKTDLELKRNTSDEKTSST